MYEVGPHLAKWQKAGPRGYETESTRGDITITQKSFIITVIGDIAYKPEVGKV